MTGWLDEHLGLVYQVSGLTFLILGVVAHVLPKKDQTLPFAQHLWLLAGFGILIGLFEFLASEIIHHQPGLMAWLHAGLLFGSYLFLLEFARRCLSGIPGGPRLPALALYGGVMSLVVFSTVLSSDPLTGLSAGINYFVGVPAALLTGAALLMFVRSGGVRGRSAQIESWIRVAALAFMAYAILTLFVPVIDARAASWFPTRTDFFQFTGLPGEFFESLCAIAITIAFVAIVRLTGQVRNDDLLRVINTIKGFIYRCNNDPDWTVTFISDGVEELSGYAADEFMRKKSLTWGSLIHPDDVSRVWDRVQTAITSRRHFEITYRIRARDGHARWVSERGRGIFDKDGRLCFIDGHVTDITARKIAELELHELNDRLEQLVIERTAALEERERLLQRAQEIAHLGHWSVNVQSGDLVWSDEIYRIFGHQPRAFSPSQDFFYKHVHPDDIERVRQHERETFATGQVLSIDHRIVLPDGRIRWVHEEAVAENDEHGRPFRLTGTALDITERKQAEEALILARDLAERASNAKSEFLSRMSHELRTPMNAILGFAQLLERQLAGQQQLDNVHEILRAARHLLDLINEVLDLSQIESGRMLIGEEAVEAGALVDSCLALVSAQAEAQGITLRNDIGDACAVTADPQRLRQVMLNLLANAIKFNRPQGEVVVSCEPAGRDRLRILVRDSGFGIPAEVIPDIYKPFERPSSTPEAVPGAGIGLALSRLLVEAMRGTISVDSTPGAGSVFAVELPRAQLSLQGAGSPVPSGARKLLCIEDNPANLRLIHRILAARPLWTIIDASSAEFGIDLARSQLPDLVLMDIGLPGMDGYTALSRLRQDPETTAIPVIALSANAMPRDIEKGVAAGFDDCLTKPIDVQNFLSVLDKMLANA